MARYGTHDKKEIPWNFFLDIFPVEESPLPIFWFWSGAFSWSGCRCGPEFRLSGNDAKKHHDGHRCCRIAHFPAKTLIGNSSFRFGYNIYDLRVWEELTPSATEWGITKEPKRDAGDEKDQRGNFLEAHGTQIIVFPANELVHSLFSIFISAPSARPLERQFKHITWGRSNCYRLKPMNSSWSHSQDRKMLTITTGTLKIIHVAKLSPNSEPYTLPQVVDNKSELDIEMNGNELLDVFDTRSGFLWGTAEVLIRSEFPSRRCWKNRPRRETGSCECFFYSTTINSNWKLNPMRLDLSLITADTSIV